MGLPYQIGLGGGICLGFRRADHFKIRVKTDLIFVRERGCG
jgi:hypothetical protein